MTSPLVLDLETVATAAALGLPYPEGERTPPSTWKDPVKIAVWKERDREKWSSEIAKTAALNPRLGRVVAAGVAFVETGEGTNVLMAPAESDEYGTLISLWEHIAAADGQIITFNGCSFDIPFFLLRSAKHGIKPTVPLKTVRDWKRKYSYGPHYDLRGVLSDWDSRASGTLTDWATFFGCYTPQAVSGKDIGDLYNAGDFAAIEKHCQDDVTSTKSLYLAVSSVYGECGSGW